LYSIRFIMFCLLLPVCFLQAQTDISFHHISTFNGLSDNYVTNTVVDKNGFLWISTSEGLNKFDGRIMKNYFKEDYPQLRNNNIREVICDDRNRLWIRTFGGFITMLDEERKWHSIHVYEGGKEKEIYNIVFTKSKGIILFRGQMHYRLKPGSDTAFERWHFTDESKFEKRLYYLDHIDQDKIIWTADGELFIMDYAREKVIFQKSIPAITSAAAADDTAIYVTTEESGGLYKLSIATGKLESLRLLKDQYDKPMFSSLQMIKRMGDGRYIISSDFAGLYLYDPISNRLVRYVHDPLNSRSISSNNYYNLVSDSSGYVFISSVSNGLSYFNIKDKPATWVSYFKNEQDDLFDGYINSMVPAALPGEYWLGCYNQLIRWNRNTGMAKFFEYGSYNGRPNRGNDEVLSLAKDAAGNIWVGTSKSGLVVLSANGKFIRQLNASSLPKGLPGNRVNHLYGIGGIMYVATLNGLCRIDTRTFALIPFNKDAPFYKLAQMPTSVVWKDSQQRIWVGAGREGSFCFDPAAGVLHNFAKSKQWASNDIYAFGEDDFGNVYIGSRLGLWVVDKNQKQWVYNRNSGLKGDRCENIVKDMHGMLWLENGNSIARFDPVRKSFAYFDEKSGFSPYGFRVRSGFADTNGLLFFGSDKGLSFFHPDSLRESPVALKLSVNQVSVDQQMFDITGTRQLSFDYNRNDLSFQVSAIDLARPKNILFQYRLSGYDKVWQSAANITSIRYSALRPGSYRFEVKASTDGQHWVNGLYPVLIEIKPAFWQTWWFRFITAFSIAMLFYYMLRIRVKQIEIRSEEKAKAEELRAQALQYQLEIEQVINYFAKSLSGLHVVDDVLWDVVRTCISQLGFQDCVLYLYNDEKTLLMQKAAYGPKNIDYKEIFNRMEIAPGSGIVGTVAATGIAEIIADTSVDERYIPDDAVRLSEIAVPITGSDGVMGVIDSEHPAKGFYTNRHLQILTAIATMVANKIEQLEAVADRQKNEIELAKLQRDVATSQLTATRAQMNPHFIFNALNSVQQYMLQGNTEDANRYLSRFSRLQREILHHCDRPYISLQKEMDMLQIYLELEQLRFNGSFEFNIAADDEMDTEEIKIPPMILQPFVENAIWHGLMPRNDNRRVSICFKLDGADEDNLLCIIEDNGIGRKASADLKTMDGTKPQHISKGLDLVFERLRLMEQHTGGSFQVTVDDVLDENGLVAGTRVELLLYTMY
jgi:two-component system LytT family sensor kinase